MPKPMRADARRNYERLLKEAARAFAERGADASLDDIAKRAGVGSGTLYRHFPTRQDLLEGVYVESIDELADQAVEFGASARAPGDALADWLQKLAEQMIHLRGLKALLGAAMTDGTSPVISDCGGRLKETAGDLLAAAQRAGAVRADLRTTEMLRLTHAVATATELGTGEPGEVRRYLALMTEGINAGPRDVA
ncbi:TetR/AcrR family transcriptional regulator [Streptomyces sp. NBC_01387]|uniref:TetR/AcrR family transcriptional regulator n=1 Tax=unclassified Streptomyces TaxID=2593676 RepID=UPI002024DD3C|nr:MULTISPECIES: TetR/AcrR family transcriptional regulator [unclassified Streptomyces]MCX4551827.1 TetR/AcrR family transcriptional regulator [Streptomyces sp. NBC_01500]WSC23191.1 TetR/AcrR family transcriptional regulator [Streptomyces sp. NBC_01766]WSV57102.1 TetR/AcrR family transcriptional regulator [Streptomyces sp. NBC_01014]